MNQNDYIILFDENGSPYIAHAGLMDRARGAVNAAANRVQQVANQAKGVGRGVRQNHKYILKVNENGRTRYFYKQEEVKAYYEAKKRGIKNAAEYAQNAVKNKASEVADKAKQGVSTAKQAIENASGVTAKRNAEASSAAAVQAKRDSAQADRVLSENRRAYAADKSQENLKRLQDSEKGAAKDFERAANASLSSAIDKRTYRNTPLGRAESEAKAAKELGSLVYDKAKDAANNTVTNAKNRFERMKSEFRDKTGQALKERAETAEKEAKDAEHERQKAAGRYSDDVNAALKSEKNFNANPNSAHAQAERDRTVNELRKSSEDYYKDGGALDTAQKKRDEAIKAREEYADFKKNNSTQAMIDKARTALKDKAEDLSAKAKSTAQSAKASAQDMIDRARTTVKDKSEDLSAKAKSTAQAAKESAQGMIDNARSSTAKAVNEAWEKIPKNADGTVNPFDSNFQSAYNDWKSKKDKYDDSLTGQAKAVAEKATDSVKDMIDRARKAISNEAPKPVLSSPNNPIQTENTIRENIIKENRIPERRITEQRIEESRIPERIESTKQTAEEQRSNDKRAAQRLSTSAELKGGEYVSLIDKYKQRYGEDYQNYLSKDEASKLQKARDNYQTAVEDADRAWDEFDKKWSKNK